jgi:hypothetical protein
MLRSDGVYDYIYRDRKLSGVFVRFRAPLHSVRRKSTISKTTKTILNRLVVKTGSNGVTLKNNRIDCMFIESEHEVFNRTRKGDSEVIFSPSIALKTEKALSMFSQNRQELNLLLSNGENLKNEH